MPKSTKPKLDRPMRKDIAKYYAEMMYKEDRDNMEMQVEEYRKKLLAEALDNIKERAYHVCPYCHERQEFKGEGHREKTINGKFYWIQNCPSCNGEVYCNIFTVRFHDQFGQADYYVDSRWMTRENALQIQQKPIPRIGFAIGHGEVKR